MRTVTKPFEHPLRVAYPGVEKIVYAKHPFSPSAFKGTPAEGVVRGEERMGWLAEDWVHNVVGVEESDWITCPYLPGTVVDGGRVREVSIRRTQTGWEWLLEVE